MRRFLQFFYFLIKSFFRKIYSPQRSIRNEAVLITGSGGYLGRHLACELSKRGVSLILWDVDDKANQQTYEALRELKHRRVYPYKIDLTNEKQVREACKEVKEKFPNLSMVILGAASMANDDNNSDEEVKLFKLFYQSPKWMLQELVGGGELSPKQKELHFVVISSACALVNLPYIATYSSLKQAQCKLIECFDEELNLNPQNRMQTSFVYLGILRDGLSQKYGNYFNINWSTSLTGEQASRQIVENILQSKKTIYLPSYFYFIQIFKALLPEKCFKLLINAQNLLKK
jgi:all-trans-retinol dehydrogenase (NAD+)